MTLNFESEYEKELPFDAREVAEKVFTFTMDYLGCPYEAEVSLLLTDDPSNSGSGSVSAWAAK